MKKFVLVTDSGCDLPLEYLEENNVILLPLKVEINGVQYKDIIDLKPEKFYEIIEDKEVIPKTSGVNLYDFEKTFKELLEKNYEILYIGLSSNLSSTYSFAQKAKETLRNKYIYLVDSKSAAFGQGLLVKEAIKMKNEGYSIRDIRDRLEELKLKLDYSVMINDIEILKRSGRINGIKAFAGEFLNIKPIISVDDGRVNILKKVKGTKAALRFLLKRLSAFEVDCDYPVVICYGTDEDLRYMMESKLREFNSDFNIESMQIGATIGSHTGKSGVGILFVRK